MRIHDLEVMTVFFSTPGVGLPIGACQPDFTGQGAAGRPADRHRSSM
ncbi:MAG: hypothetical protein SFV17_28170 [Candidatus Obscuribacter sp.]|nr:hypothetical protein [Candidatus Obscuribacter sp.]